MERIADIAGRTLGVVLVVLAFVLAVLIVATAARVLVELGSLVLEWLSLGSSWELGRGAGAVQNGVNQ